MVYQDHLTQFCILRPLTSKHTSEVAYQLLDIYLLLGAPSILQSDNRSEFTVQMWPDLVIIHGKPRQPLSQGSVERANCNIKDMLIAWMSDNDTQGWTVGLKFVQFQKNSSHHTGIKRSPFAALFGADAKVGLTSSSLPQYLIARSAYWKMTSCLQHPIQTQSSNPARKQNLYQSLPSLYVRRKLGSRERVCVCMSARDTQFQQAEIIVKRSRIVFSIGSNVTVPIPSVDRGRTDPRNIIRVVTECSDNELYTMAVKGGIFDRKYSRNQFDVCATILYLPDDVCTDEDISLRQAMQLESRCGGQGFTRCVRQIDVNDSKPD